LSPADIKSPRMIGAKFISNAVQITMQRQMHTFVLAFGPTHLF